MGQQIMNKNKIETNEAEALKRLKKMSDKIKKKNIVPPVDKDEPTGRLSGGFHSIDIEKDYDEKKQ